MILSRYGLREWGLATAIAIAIVLIAGRGSIPPIWVIATVGFVWFVIAAFFRDPLLRKPATESSLDLVSPADGVVSAVFTIDHHPATDSPATIVRIFLSVLDVHINRMPCEATVISTLHTPGRYLDARSPESAQVNESNLILLRNSEGERLGVRQVSGAIARRIVCPLSAGDSFARGERFGMIKFGSTTELIVPTRLTDVVRVAKGDRVTGGVTILVSMKSKDITLTANRASSSATAAGHA